MSKKQYYEAHITMEGLPEDIRSKIDAAFEKGNFPSGWKFSAIDGDANLGNGLKCYLTTQLNTKIGEYPAQRHLLFTAEQVSKLGIKVLRRKIELVLWDDRISDVPCTAEECATCSEHVA